MFTLTTLALLLLGLFLLGLVVGYVYSKDSEDTTRSKVRTVIAITVTAMWVVAMFADILITGYTVSPLVHAMMGAIVGFFFADNEFVVDLGG